jgi:periplasmic protein TonB
MERSSRNDLIVAGAIAVLLHAALALWQMPSSYPRHGQEARLAEAMTIDLVAKRPAAVVTAPRKSPEPARQRESRPLPQRQETPRTVETPKPERPAPVPAVESRESTLLSPAQMAPSQGESAELGAPAVAPSGGAVAGQETGKVPAFVESRPPAYGQRQDPEYPEFARRRGYQGTTLLRVRVLEDGRVAAVQIKESSGYQLLDGTATKAVWTWRFAPALADGRPVASWVLVPVTFRLQ